MVNCGQPSVSQDHAQRGVISTQDVLPNYPDHPQSLENIGTFSQCHYPDVQPPAPADRLCGERAGAGLIRRALRGRRGGRWRPKPRGAGLAGARAEWQGASSPATAAGVGGGALAGRREQSG